MNKIKILFIIIINKKININLKFIKLIKKGIKIHINNLNEKNK